MSQSVKINKSQKIRDTRKVRKSIVSNQIVSFASLLDACQILEGQYSNLGRKAFDYELGKAWGVTGMAVSRYRSGQRAMKVAHLVMITERYGLTWEQIGKLLSPFPKKITSFMP